MIGRALCAVRRGGKIPFGTLIVLVCRVRFSSIACGKCLLYARTLSRVVRRFSMRDNAITP
jgi:hypothetical protein